MSAWSVGGSAAVAASPVHSGSYSAMATGPSVWAKSLGSGYGDLFFGGYVLMPSMLQSGQVTTFVAIQDAAYSHIVAGGLQVSGGSAYWNLRVNNNWYTVPAAVNANQWYFVEVEYNSAGTAKLWVDGSLLYTASGQSLSGNAAVVQGGNPFGGAPSGFVSYGDDFVAATSYITPGSSVPASTPTATTTPTVTPTPVPTQTPPASNVVSQDGFEGASLSAWSVGGSAAVAASPVHSGSYSAMATGPSVWAKSLGSGYGDLFFGGYVLMPSMLQSGQVTTFVAIQDAAYSHIVAGGLQVSGGSAYWNLRVNNNWYTVPAAVNANQWYFVEVEYNSAGTAKLWVDGSLLYTASGQSLSGNAAVVQGGNPFGGAPSGFVSYGDDFVAATSYITPGYSVLDAAPAATTTPAATPTPTPAPSSVVTPAPSTGGAPWLHTSGQNIYDSSGRQVKLYGVTIPWGQGNEQITQSDIQSIRSKGFNSIRIFVMWCDVQPTSPSSVNTAIFTSNYGLAGTSIDNIVSWAAQEGIYVEICTGWSPSFPAPSWTGFGSDMNSVTTKILQNTNNVWSGISYMYQWMAQHYAANSNVIFESFNEMETSTTSLAGSAFANFNDAWVSAIEKGEGSNSHLKIIEFLIQSGPYSPIFTAPYISGSHSNIMLASHDYASMSSADTTGVAARLVSIANAAHNAGLPWVDTEFSKSLDQVGWDNWLHLVLSTFKQYNIAGWSYFCYDGNVNNEASGAATWNIKNPSIGAQVLPILQQYMT
ncbi:MAG: cellulase family glycosylhydrolase [Candidatus Bathyarchaeota archaeon]|nr:cellulase family glycosylhydrolase [Candidatus Bathyarchaeota archaeon]